MNANNHQINTHTTSWRQNRNPMNLTWRPLKLDTRLARSQVDSSY